MNTVDPSVILTREEVAHIIVGDHHDIRMSTNGFSVSHAEPHAAVAIEAKTPIEAEAMGYELLQVLATHGASWRGWTIRYEEPLT